MGATRELTQFVTNLRYEDLPRPIADRMKLLLLDSIGCSVFSSTVKHCQQLNRVVTKLGGNPEATIFGTSIRTSAYNAALSNGTQIQGFESDDVGVYCHPASCIMPSGFAMAEALGGISGKTMIAAHVAAYEATIRIAESTGFFPEGRIGWHTPPFHGSIGGAICAGKIAGLDEEQMFHAIGISADIAGGGLFSSRCTAAASKRLHAGRAGAIGVLSAMLAKEEFTGVWDVLEFEPWGYCWALSGYDGEGERPWDIDIITRGLGKEYIGLDRVVVKYYPTVAFNIPVMDNVRALKREHQFTNDMIERVNILMAKMHVEGARMYRPVNDLTGANFSARYSAALGLLYDPPRLSESPIALKLWHESYKEQAVQDLMAKMNEVVDEELEARNPYSIDTTVELHLKDGRVLRRSTEYTKGLASIGAMGLLPMERRDIQNKFRNMVATVLPEKTTEELIETFDHLEECDDVSPVLLKLWLG